MNSIVTIAIFSIGLICLLVQNCKATYFDQTDTGFKYHLNSKKITPESNPTFSKKGWKTSWGINTRYFKTSNESSRYLFTADKSDSSPSDESLSWDGVEGITQKIDFVIKGYVSDPRLFYMNFGKTMRSYEHNNGKVFKDSSSDASMYEAQRWAAMYIDIIMGEVTQLMQSEDIRLKTDTLATILLDGISAKQIERLWYTGDLEGSNITPRAIVGVKEFMKPFGFTIEEVSFPEAVSYPNGDILYNLRLRGAKVDYEISVNEEYILDAQLEANIKSSSSKREANKIRAKARQKADKIEIETRALANDMKERISLVGIQGALRLEASDFFRNLAENGSFSEIYATPNSILGQALQPETTPTLSTNKNTKEMIPISLNN